MVTNGLFPALDNQQRRIFRLAFAVAGSSAVAIGIAWPLSFITPMLISSIVSGSDEAPTPKKILFMLLIIGLGMLAGITFSSLFIHQPTLACLLLTLIFYWIYYFSNREKLPNFAGIMLILGMTVIPLMSQVDASLASSFAISFILAAAAAMIFACISHFIFPHQDTETTLVDVTAKPDIPSLATSRRLASISTLVVMPAIIFFLTFNLLNSALIIAFIAILSMNPALEQGKKAGIGLILGNCLGGAVAIVFYQLMKTAPHYGFYVALIGLFSLFIARQIYSGRKAAAFWGMALSTLLVLTGPIFTGEGGDTGAKFFTRIAQITAVAVYVVMAFRLTSELLPCEASSQTSTDNSANSAAKTSA